MIGTAVLSLDTELAWGSFHLRMGPELMRAARWTNEVGIPRLLELLCRYRISATWAFVGHLVLDGCSGHPELAAVHYDWFQHDWFSFDPCSDESHSPQWYARRRFLQVLKAPHPQEIGFHSFSHVDFADRGTPRLRAVQEYAACRAIAEQFNIPAPTFIFPFNHPGFLHQLRETGFRYYRPPAANRLPSWPRLSRIIGLSYDFLRLTPATVLPSMADGLVLLPASLMLRSMRGWRGLIPVACRRDRVRKGLQSAVRTGRIFHLWFHPIDLYNRNDVMFVLLEKFCEEVSRLRERGDLRIATFGQVCEEYAVSLAASRLSPSERVSVL